MGKKRLALSENNSPVSKQSGNAKEQSQGKHIKVAVEITRLQHEVAYILFLVYERNNFRKDCCL